MGDTEYQEFLLDVVPINTPGISQGSYVAAFEDELKERNVPDLRKTKFSSKEVVKAINGTNVGGLEQRIAEAYKAAIAGLSRDEGGRRKRRQTKHRKSRKSRTRKNRKRGGSSCSGM
jgi:hypothetical protein